MVIRDVHIGSKFFIRLVFPSNCAFRAHTLTKLRFAERVCARQVSTETNTYNFCYMPIHSPQSAEYLIARLVL